MARLTNEAENDILQHFKYCQAVLFSSVGRAMSWVYMYVLNMCLKIQCCKINIFLWKLFFEVSHSFTSEGLEFYSYQKKLIFFAINTALH